MAITVNRPLNLFSLLSVLIHLDVIYHKLILFTLVVLRRISAPTLGSSLFVGTNHFVG